MALPILDGNQSATTLSTIVTGGQHIPAHTVVSLGSQAITDMRGAVSGSVVSISNLPATQTIAGTVTANVQDGVISSVGYISAVLDGDGNTFGIDRDFPISGTVTANAIGTRNFVDINGVTVSGFLGIGGWDSANSQYAPLPLNDSGTGLQVTYDFASGGSFPISGTVTANNPSGALTTRFGSVTTANTAQLTSAVTNTSRKYLLVQNIATSTVTIGIGFAPTTTQGIQLTAGAGLTFDAFTPTGAIYWLSSVTGSNFSILEG
jgi:hypothetical protein